MALKMFYKPVQLERLEKMKQSDREALDVYQINELVTAAADNLVTDYRKSGGTDYNQAVKMIEQQLLESGYKMGGNVGKYIVGVGELAARRASAVFIDESILSR